MTTIQAPSGPPRLVISSPISSDSPSPFPPLLTTRSGPTQARHIVSHRFNSAPTCQLAPSPAQSNPTFHIPSPRFADHPRRLPSLLTCQLNAPPVQPRPPISIHARRLITYPSDALPTVRSRSVRIWPDYPS